MYKIITTDYKNQLFWSENKNYETSQNPMIAINLYPEITYQEIKGFGGAFTEAGGYNLSLLSKEKQWEIMEAYFGDNGLNYNLCRTHINSCDFSLGNYAYLEKETDENLTGFTIERDEKYLIPMITMAQNIAKCNLTLLASPWSPPAFMKSNGEMNHGGLLKEEYYQMWADYIVKYIKEYEKIGIRIQMLTIQNEPQAVQSWDSCIYSGKQEQSMAGEYLGPTLEKNNLSHIKILIWDHNKELMYQRTKEILQDQAARSYVAGVAFHWYSGDHFEAVALVREKYPEMELYFTEGCVEYSRFADSNEVAKAEMYAHDMIGNFNGGMNGYIDWNMLLDQMGGPNHVKNYCAAPIMCNTLEDSVEKRLSYYYIGHFSKFCKVGAKRFATTKYTDKLDVVGFCNPDGERVVVILNKSENAIPVSLAEYEEGITFLIESHTITTVTYKKPGKESDAE